MIKSQAYLGIYLNSNHALNRIHLVKKLPVMGRVTIWCLHRTIHFKLYRVIEKEVLINNLSINLPTINKYVHNLKIYIDILQTSMVLLIMKQEPWIIF